MSVSQPFEPAFKASSSDAETSPAPETPRVWLLLDDRPGHTTQVVGLAEALGWSYETRVLKFNILNRISNRILGTSRVSLNVAHSEPLEPPWPDMVFAMGRRTAPIARWIKRRSGNRSKIVQLGRKAANVADDFDLAISCPHFQLPAHPDRFENVLPLTQVTPDRLAAAQQRWPELLSGAAEPRMVLLVGGSTAHHMLAPDAARRMAAAVEAFATKRHGSLTCVTSRRTGAAVTDALRAGAPHADIHEWQADRDHNPYLGYLALADILVVTGESESMLAEAAWSGKPLYIYPIEERPLTLRSRLKGMVLRCARRQPQHWLGGLCAGLIRCGAVVPPRDLTLMHRAMIELGIAARFGHAADQFEPSGLPNLDALLARVRALVSE